MARSAAAWRAAAIAILGMAAIQPATRAADETAVVRVGHLPNLTHAQAVIGRAGGWFEERLGGRVEWRHFNAGPSAMEALLAGAIDLAYIGPSPAINVFVRSQGGAIRLIAGGASGGASLVVRRGCGIERPEDFLGKKVAAPEVGNTQDVALRHWLSSYGLRPRAQGGDVDVLAINNPDILSLFLRGSLDAAWVPEPWATRLLQEAGGALFLDERDLWPEGRFPTTVLVAGTAFLRSHRDVVERFVRAHAELTEWLGRHPEEARRRLNEGLAQWLGAPLPEAIVEEAWSRVEFVAEPPAEALTVLAKRAWELGFLPGAEPPDLSGLIEIVDTPKSVVSGE